MWLLTLKPLLLLSNHTFILMTVCMGRLLCCYKVGCCRIVMTWPLNKLIYNRPACRTRHIFITSTPWGLHCHNVVLFTSFCSLLTFFLTSRWLVLYVLTCQLAQPYLLNNLLAVWDSSLFFVGNDIISATRYSTNLTSGILVALRWPMTSPLLVETGN